MSEDTKPENKPWEAVAEVSRVSSADISLHGSPFRHYNYIEFRIREATGDREPGGEYYLRSGKMLAEFAMSEQQFMQMITGMNSGKGAVPVTLRFLSGKGMLPLPPKPDDSHEWRDAEIERLATEAIKDVSDALPRVEELLQKKNLTQSDRNELLKHYRAASGILRGAIPDVVAAAKLKLVKMREGAKSEINSMMNNWLNRFGLKSLAEKEGIQELKP